MSRKERPGQSDVRVSTIRDPELQTVLGKFSDLFKTCAGPTGKFHLVRNACGGHVTMTGSCGRLLEAMLLTRPELKLLASAVQAHLHSHRDGGLFFMAVCSRLILSCAESELNPSTVASLYASFLEMIISYLNEPDCPACVRTDFSDLSILLSYVKSVLVSKPLLNLSTSDCDHLTQLVVKTFLESVPSDNLVANRHVSDGVHVLTLDNIPISDCRLESGLLLRYPEVITMEGVQKLSTIRNSLPEKCPKIGVDLVSCIRVSMFTCSLSGDLEEVADAHFELSEDQNTSVEREVVDSVLMSLCEALEESGVGLVLCQRVIHPSIKATLRAKGILYVDRMGSLVIPYLQDLTYCQPVRSAMDPGIVDDCLGWVSDVDHVILGGRSFLCLRRPMPCPVSTLVLGALLEERMHEMKKCVEASLYGLSQLAQTKTLLLGAGCWQVHCAQWLQDKILLELSSLAKTHHCSQSIVLRALSFFTGSLHAWAHSLNLHSQDMLYVDPDCWHLWREPREGATTSTPSDGVKCCCGGKKVAVDTLSNFKHLSNHESQFGMPSRSPMSESVTVSDDVSDCDLVYDCFSSSVNALRQAVTTAGLILSISQFISDKN